MVKAWAKESMQVRCGQITSPPRALSFLKPPLRIYRAVPEKQAERRYRAMLKECELNSPHIMTDTIIGYNYFDVPFDLHWGEAGSLLARYGRTTLNN